MAGAGWVIIRKGPLTILEPALATSWWRRGQVIRAPDLRSASRKLKSRYDYVPGLVSP